MSKLEFTCSKSTTETLEKVCSKLTLKKPEQWHWRHCAVSILDFEKGNVSFYFSKIESKHFGKNRELRILSNGMMRTYCQKCYMCMS